MRDFKRATAAFLSRSTVPVVAAACLGVAALAGCGQEYPGEPSASAADATEIKAGAFTGIAPFGTTFTGGMRTTFTQMPATNLNMANTVGLTACDATSLYAIERNPSTGALTLKFSLDSGQSWTSIGDPGGATSPLTSDVACDDGHLFTLSAGKQVYFIDTNADGGITFNNDGSTRSWQNTNNTTGVDHIQGGDGTIYGIQGTGTQRSLFIIGTHLGLGYTWSSTPIASGLGSNFVSGTGNDKINVPLGWPRRAYTTETNGTVFFNDTILAGQNAWTLLNVGSERFTVVTVAAPGILYGIDTFNGPRLVLMEMSEENCTNDADDDADGRRDTEDRDCFKPRADAFCMANADGKYCSNRYTPATFLGQTNQNTALLECANHKMLKLTPGACVQVSMGQDRLSTVSELAGADPVTGRWCNVVRYSDGKWGFNFSGSTPCATLQSQLPGSVVVRAGLFSTTGTNNVNLFCDNGSALFGGTGSTPLQNAKNVVGATSKLCVFNVTATTIPIFSKPFPLTRQVGPPGPFNHTYSCIPLAQFGFGELDDTKSCSPTTGSPLSSHIDRFGHNVAAIEFAHDFGVNGGMEGLSGEGTEVYAMFSGTVVNNGIAVPTNPDNYKEVIGSRDRDIVATGCRGACTPHQGEIYIQHYAGSNPAYREGFVSYYAHLRRRLVVDGQTVKAGQLIGFTGRSGAAGGPHLHIGVFRTSNSNAHQVGNLQRGYHVNFQTTTSVVNPSGNNQSNFNAIDFFGWANGSAFDPAAYVDWNSDTGLDFLGKGAWSANLFKPNESPHDP